MLCLNLFLFNITLNYIYLTESGDNQVCIRKEIFTVIKDDWESDLDTLLMVLEKKIAEKTKMYFKIHPDNVNAYLILLKTVVLPQTMIRTNYFNCMYLELFKYILTQFRLYYSQ